jgi:hypothetical protein
MIRQLIIKHYEKMNLVGKVDAELHHLLPELIGVVAERALEEVAAGSAGHPLHTGPSNDRSVLELQSGHLKKWQPAVLAIRSTQVLVTTGRYKSCRAGT